MKNALLIAILFAPALGWAQRSVAEEQRCFKLIGHANARACLEQAAQSAAKARSEAEDAMQLAVKQWDQEETEKSRAALALQASQAAFLTLRRIQCDLLASLAAGGNGAGDRRLLCEIELDRQRAAYLRLDISSLQE
ncbi:MAG TPA: lysozyme inhibitor LprI family protein [Burkholderiaceae bacterium]|jgi:uncharacterized protein YecT (DUF1311 family)